MFFKMELVRSWLYYGMTCLIGIIVGLFLLLNHEERKFHMVLQNWAIEHQVVIPNKKNNNNSSNMGSGASSNQNCLEKEEEDHTSNNNENCRIPNNKKKKKTIYLIRHSESEENRRLQSLGRGLKDLTKLKLPSKDDVVASIELLDTAAQIDSDVSPVGKAQVNFIHILSTRHH